NEDAKYGEDRIALADEAAPSTERRGSWAPLLELVMTNGRQTDARSHEESSREARDARRANLGRARQRAADEMKRLPDELLALKGTMRYQTTFSERLTAEREALERSLV